MIDIPLILKMAATEDMLAVKLEHEWGGSREAALISHQRANALRDMVDDFALRLAWDALPPDESGASPDREVLAAEMARREIAA